MGFTLQGWAEPAQADFFKQAPSLAPEGVKGSWALLDTISLSVGCKTKLFGALLLRGLSPLRTVP